jgi:hypothetical protein
MPQGSTRQVEYDGRYAIKTPRPDRAERARCLNRWEAELWTVWQPRFRWPHLCPVVEADPQGNRLVMLRVAQEDVTDEEVQSYTDRLFEEFRVLPGTEYKARDWGRLDGQLVVVDYGFICDSEQAIVKERAVLQRWLEP